MLAALRPCATPGCPEVTRHGHCVQHTRVRESQRVNAHQRGYTRHWSALRRWFLARHPLCGERESGAPKTSDSRCLANGLIVAAAQVDHILRHQGPVDPLFSNILNMQSLCASCHSAKTARENTELRT